MTPSDSIVPENESENLQSQEFSFRPLTQGLGFHHEKQQWPQPKVSNTTNLQKSRTTPIPSAGPISRETNSIHKIYGAPMTATSSNTTRTTGLQNSGLANLSDVALFPQFVAWTIDLIVIGLGTLFIILCSSFITFGNFTGPFYSTFSGDFYLLFTTLFCLFYLFYFTLLDLNSSIGKSLMSIKVIPTGKDKIDMKATFTRAFVSLISLMGLGIPSVLDFQGKLSKTALKK